VEKYRELKYINNVRDVVEKGGRGLALLTIGMSIAKADFEYKETGRVSTATAADIGISTTLLALSFTPLAPLAWGAGIIYGGIRLFQAKNIDNWFNSFKFW
jgi:hypothetical protein